MYNDSIRRVAFRAASRANFAAVSTTIHGRTIRAAESPTKISPEGVPLGIQSFPCCASFLEISSVCQTTSEERLLVSYDTLGEHLMALEMNISRLKLHARRTTRPLRDRVTPLGN